MDHRKGMPVIPAVLTAAMEEYSLGRGFTVKPFDEGDQNTLHFYISTPQSSLTTSD
jgi:hypothetical protein